MISIQGKGVSNGVALGPLYFYQRASSTITRTTVSDTAAEWDRFKAAQARAIEQLGELADKAREEAGDEAALLFETHQMMAEDLDYEETIQGAINDDHLNAEAAVSDTAEQFAGMFASMDDPYMQARSADVKDGAHFECSSKKLNKLHEICRRTFRANLQSVQSDCPGREKFGYGGDIAASAESFRCNWLMAPFYRKTVRDFLDEASGDGLFTETAPYVGIGSKSVIPPSESGGRKVSPMGWALGVPVLLDLLARYDGDIDIVREAYPAVAKFAERIAARYPEDEIPECLGDWIAIEKADMHLTSLAHWHEYLTKTAKLARMLGKDADEKRFSARAAKVAERFRAKYARSGGVVNSGLQGEQLFALYSGLLERGDVPAALAVLEKDIVAHGRSLTTGFFGTQYLFEVLSANGMAALAGDVATHEGYPGYFHMIDRGATTLWEHWNEDACRNIHSNCHPMFGSVEQWFMRCVLGICVTEDAIGCDKVRICPHAVADVKWANGWLDTPKGRISVSWRLEGGKMKVFKSIPPGVSVVD